MTEPRPKKLLEQVQDAIRLKPYFFRTEETDVQWIRRNLREFDRSPPTQTPPIAPSAKPIAQPNPRSPI